MWVWVDIAAGFVLFILVSSVGKYLSVSYEFSSHYGVFAFAKNELSFRGNFFLNVLLPPTYIAILAAIWQSLSLSNLVKNIWLIIVIFWIFRYLFFIIVLNRFRYLNIKYELFSATLSVILGYFVYSMFVMKLLNANESIFIPLSGLRDAIWYAIIVFIASLIWTVIKKGLSNEKIYPEDKKKAMVKRRYEYLKNKYNNYILESIAQTPYTLSCDSTDVILLVYAIMIFEDFNRPKLVRMFEYLIKAIQPRRTMTLGIMQVETKKRVNDIESIDIAINKIYRALSNENNLYLAVRKVLYDYNHDNRYYHEVNSIFNKLIQFENQGHALAMTEIHI